MTSAIEKLKQNRSASYLFVVATLSVLAVSFVACTSSRSSAGSASGGVVPVVVDPNVTPTLGTPLAPTEPLAPTVTPAATAPTTTQAVVPSTDAPTTTESTTTDAPTTTESPTTVAPTTTQAPTTTSTIPANIVAVPKGPEPLAAVGGGSGANTVAVQNRLLELGFWLAGPDGKFGLTTKQAVMAFQKYIGIPATGKVDEWTAFALTDASEKPHGQSNTGTLVEIDKARQLLFIVVDGRTQWTFNTSTGSGAEYAEPDKNTPGEIITGVALTPDGLFKTDREKPDGWWDGDLGQIYRPKYFRGGIAVHGSGSVPNYPASHGCVRLTTQAMDFVWDANLVPLGTTVWVHN